jgi:hypothetical protein
MAAAPIFRVAFLVALVSLLTVAVPGQAAAQDQAAVNKVTNLNKKALDAYNQQDYDTARNLLKEALELCDSAGLQQHPITARTHVHFGVVAIVGFKNREVGLKQFKKALEIEPDIKLTKSLVTPELQDAFEEAVLAGEKGGGGGAAAAAGGTDNAGGGESAGGAASAGGGEDNAGGAAAGGDDDEDHPKPRPKQPPHKNKGDEDEGGQDGTIFLGVTIGSSAGLASGSGHMNPAHALGGPGFAVGQLGQIEPQLGFFVNSSTLLSIVGRFQYVSGLNGENLCGPNGDQFCNPTTLVGAVLGRVTFLMSEGPFHFTVGGQIGGGYVAHAVVFGTDTACGTSMSDAGHTECVDALLGGPFLIGPTVGLMWELGEVANFVAGVNSELGVPKFTFNFDLDVGLAFRL